MIRCQACGHENPDGSSYCNHCGAAIGGDNPLDSSDALPKREKTLVLPGLASTTIVTKGQLKERMVFEICLAAILIIGGFVIGQPVYGVLLGLVALGAGYIIYLFSTEAS